MSKVHFTPTNATTHHATAQAAQSLQYNDATHIPQDLAHIALQSLTHAVITTNLQGQIQYCNTSAQKLLRHARASLSYNNLVGIELHAILPLLHRQTHQPINPFIAQLRTHPQALAIVDQAILVTDAHQEHTIDITVAPMYDADQNLIGAVFMLQDVTEATQAIQTLEWQASHDSLTGLVNRTEFEAQLTQIIQAAQVSTQTHTLCYIDIDQFKIFNDTAGHNAGDALLQQLSHMFQQEVRSTDILSRLGGDEFGILFHNCSLKEAYQIIERIYQQVRQFRFLWREQSFSVSASFGLVQIDSASQNLTAVLREADAACYAAKEAGRNRIHLYCSDDSELMRQRSERLWIIRITQAIEAQRFQLYAQAIAPIIRNGAVRSPLEVGQFKFERHMEILLRMIDHDGTIIPPGAFIPAAERYGLMTAIDRVVIETFFQSYAQACLSNSGRPLDRCLYTINLSARSLNDPQFIQFVKKQFEQYRLPPQMICFEITETTAISNIDQASQFIQELKQMGCHFALDDFGSGMNGFAYLKQLDIDYLKIDGSFIKNITTDKVDQELVACMNRIAHVLGVKTVAEWVENDAILQKLSELDVDYAQGYGIHKPEPLVFESFA